jgi:predicted nuclease with TOPRIM domain
MLQDNKDRLQDEQNRLQDEYDRLQNKQYRLQNEKDMLHDEQGRLREEHIYFLCKIYHVPCKRRGDVYVRIQEGNFESKEK